MIGWSLVVAYFVTFYFVSYIKLSKRRMGKSFGQLIKRCIQKSHVIVRDPIFKSCQYKQKRSHFFLFSSFALSFSILLLQAFSSSCASWRSVELFQPSVGLLDRPLSFSLACYPFLQSVGFWPSAGITLLCLSPW